MIDKPVVLTEEQRDWIQLYSTRTQAQAAVDDASSSGTGGGSGRGSVAKLSQEYSLGWAGQALVGVADGKWSEARDAIHKSKLLKNV